jgi:hypothetical protein
MTARAVAPIAAAFVLVALVLCGCVASPPAGLSENELAQHRARILANTWANTGLPGEQPGVESHTASTSEEWLASMAECIGAIGLGASSWGYSTSEGYVLGTASGGDVDDPEALREFYVCAASYGPPQSFEELRSNAQLDYIYDYYQKSLVPCMIMNGFRPEAAPTRVEFHAIAGQWSPYYSVDVGLSAVQYEELEGICGAEIPSLD